MFKITARTVLELGSELISSDHIAFYELIKNGFDARTKTGVRTDFRVVLGRRSLQEVKLKTTRERDLEEAKHDAIKRLNASADDLYQEAVALISGATTYDGFLKALDDTYLLNTITVSDTGTGMTLDELGSVFMTIGTDSRRLQVDDAIDRGASSSPFLGEKGIGRLSAMRLGDRLFVRTATQKDKNFNELDIDWSRFDEPGLMLHEVAIEPGIGKKKADPDFSGTDIVISNLVSDWSEARVRQMAVDEIALISNPLRPLKERPRLPIYWNGERITAPRLDPEFLSHAHAKVKGNYEITADGPLFHYEIEIRDLGFEHPVRNEVGDLSVSDLHGAILGLRAKRKTQSKRDADLTALETVGPFSFELHWFNRTRLKKIDSIGNQSAVRKLLDQWMGIRLYRDGFRVYPYGTEEDDWLSLDQSALRSSGFLVNRIQTVGDVRIGRVTNPRLIDQTNREGLRETPEAAVLREAMMLVIDRLRREMQALQKTKDMDDRELDLGQEKVASLEQRMDRAISSLRAIVGPSDKETIQDLEQLKFEFTEFAADARKQIQQIEADAQQMLDMAAVGLMVEVVAHELARVAEDALDNLSALKMRKVPDEIRDRLNSLQASMKSISKRLRVLDPMSVSGRQRAESFDLVELITDTFDAHAEQFRRHDVEINLDVTPGGLPVRLVKGMVVQILENLISNALYWMELEADRKPEFRPKISVSLTQNPVVLRFSDNGPGITPAYVEKVFDLFFSMKDKSRRRGLGLYIARDCAKHNGGSLYIDKEITNSSGRYNTFVYEVATE